MNESEHTNLPSQDAWAALYQTASQQWAHAEQIRWTLLYNYLMASTILVLAWSAVFASSDHSREKAFVLLLLSLGGAGLSGLWVALGVRASGFVRTYAAAGHVLESDFIKVAGIAPPNSPFAVARNHRNQVTGVAKWACSAMVLWIVPTVFLFIYVALVWVSLRQLGEPLAPAGTIVIGVLGLCTVAFVVQAYRQLPKGHLD